MLFREMGGVDAFPIALDTYDVNEIVATIQHIAPVFGGVNLEDISAPRCFEIEAKLRKTLTIPVVHDDQHATAIVVVAALLNAAKVIEKPLRSLRVVINGIGPAGAATTYLLKSAGLSHIITLDSKGIVFTSRPRLEPYKQALARVTNFEKRRGGLSDALEGAHVFIGLSRAGVLRSEHIRRMAPRPIIFALANPVPEILPDQAKKAGAYVIATGRSDFPNQINNALVFPGLFRGALDHHVRLITDHIKLRAARSLAGLVAHPTRDHIIPSLFDKRVARAVAQSVR
jgi:malate dehydrogenase (oxaloacetate-decarboxylating)